MSAALSWQRIKPEFTASANDPLSISALTLELSLFFEQIFGREAVKDRFSLPSGYKIFLEALQTTHVSQTIGGWDFCFFGPSAVLSNTKYSCELFSKDDFVQDAGMWIEIGAYNDKHTLFLCCDRGNSFFRQIKDGHDEHPWLNGVSHTDAKTIEAFLKTLHPRR